MLRDTSLTDTPLTTDPRALADLEALAHDLTHPPALATAEQLAEHWHCELHRFEAILPDGMEDFPELSLRLRGAFGRALRMLPARQTATGRVLPHAADVLFRPLGQRNRADEVPRPALIRGWAEGRMLIIEQRVFGWAMPWASDGAAAMLLALGDGIALSSTARQRVPVQVVDVTHTRIAGIVSPARPTWAALRFRSPVTVRRRAATRDDPRALLRACVQRIEAMARWQGFAMAPASSDVFAAIADADVTDSDLVACRWSRHSIRQGNTAIPMDGRLGTLIARGDLAPLAPYLALAETCNTGSHASLGMGWFDLSWM